MKKKPKVVLDPPFYDDEERELIEDLRAGVYQTVPNQAARMKELKAMAESTLKRKSVTIRIQERVIDQLKSMANEEGMPYQTLISSVLHKYISGKLKEGR
ncbi:MAG: BrnA antitoxin family protein [Alphaproteobacteria bacterium]|nr:BrnA antitoxin family protein [Alphaproteobacteria bacterium]